MRQLTSIAALLALAVSGCSNPHVTPVSSHPPALDLVCPPEPPALTDEQVIGDTDGTTEQAFNDAVLIAGRACRDALARTCAWHRERGAAVICEAVKP